MSLINQMLQDLDARRSDVSGGGSFGQQIRAVPERRRFHPAWWVALALGGMLIGVIGYIVLRPQAPAPQGMASKLPLKLDVDINASGAMQTDDPVAVPAVVQPPSQPAVAPAVVEAPPAAPVTSKLTPAAGQDTHTVERSHAMPAAPQLKVPIAPPLPSAKTFVPPPAAKVPEPIVPPLVNKQVKELTPAQRAENEYRKAVHALQLGKRAEAASGLEQTLQLDPRHAGARQALIGVLLDGGQQDEAMQKAREGLASDPAQPSLAMILARLQLEKGELRPAIDTLERVLPHASEKPDYLAFLAALLQRDERHKQAAEHYLLALQKAPQNGVWWMGLGISLQAERRNAEASESFRRARATNSLTPELLAFVEARIRQLQQ